MNDESVVRAAVYLMRSMGEKPSASRVIEIMRVASSKKRGGMNRGEVCRHMKTILGDRFETETAKDETASRPIPSTSETAISKDETVPRHHVRNKTRDIDKEEIPNGISPRVRISPVRLNDDFGTLESLVVSVLAHDAAERSDGKISSNVVDQLRQRLARARAKHGTPAFEAGLTIALDKGKGVAYGCGCMKRYDPSAESTPQERNLGKPDKIYEVFHVPNTPEYVAHVQAQRDADLAMEAEMVKWG